MRIFSSFFILNHIKGDYKIKNLNLRQIWEVKMLTETKSPSSNGEEWDWDGKENGSTLPSANGFSICPKPSGTSTFRNNITKRGTFFKQVFAYTV
jgi:hypothetical protein